MVSVHKISRPDVPLFWLALSLNLFTEIAWRVWDKVMDLIGQFNMIPNVKFSAEFPGWFSVLSEIKSSFLIFILSSKQKQYNVRLMT